MSTDGNGVAVRLGGGVGVGVGVGVGAGVRAAVGVGVEVAVGVGAAIPVGVGVVVGGGSCVQATARRSIPSNTVQMPFTRAAAQVQMAFRLGANPYAI